ncbi:MAG TPA: hypothetical protein VGI27_02065, partial [Solirubrobacteraceae bacterium]
TVSPLGGGSGRLPEQGILPLREASSPSARIAGRVFTASRHGTLRLRVSCPATVVSCSGRIVLRARTAIAAGASPSAKVNTVLLTLAAGSFTIRGGQLRTLTMRLSAEARLLLARRHVLEARATIASRDPAGLAQTAHTTVTIRAPR